MTTRREFIQALGATGAALAGLSACGGGGGNGSSGGGSTQPPIPVPAAPILVVVNIDGGWDWLNVLPPNSGTNLGVYQAKRANLGITNPTLLTDLGGGIALNHDFIGMDQLHALGRVAWIPGIGMPNPNLSHFTSIDLWGQGATVPAGNGWLGRFADSAFNPSGDVLRGLTVTSDLPVMLKGSNRSFVSIPSAGGYVFPAYLFSGATMPDATLLEGGWGTALNATSIDPGYLAAAQAGRLFFDAQNNPAFGTGGSIATRTPTVPYPGDATYPVTKLSTAPLTSSLSNQFKLIAQMIAAGLPAQVFFSRLSGWDTHSNQAVDHPNLQRALGGSIKAFYDDLSSITTASGNAQDRVMILAYSEFGRRVQENNGGTDHGTAGLSFCVGRAVKGGLFGGYPDLTNLDSNGNMKFTTDFRSLYATVLERWLGQAATSTDGLLGTTYPRLGFL